MQPPARIRSVLLSDRRIFKQGLFIMKTVRGTLPRLVFCGKFNIQIKIFACRIKHKETFPLSYFCMTKSTKSHQGGLTPSSLQPPRRARVSRASHAWCVRAAKDRAKISSFAAPHSFSYTTRANISHEKTEQIRARIVCTPAESAGRA